MSFFEFTKRKSKAILGAQTQKEEMDLVFLLVPFRTNQKRLPSKKTNRLSSVKLVFGQRVPYPRQQELPPLKAQVGDSSGARNGHPSVGFVLRWLASLRVKKERKSPTCALTIRSKWAAFFFFRVKLGVVLKGKQKETRREFLRVPDFATTLTGTSFLLGFSIGSLLEYLCDSNSLGPPQNASEWRLVFT